MASSMEATKILPSPIRPVWAACWIASTARSTRLSSRTTSTFTLGRKSTTYSAPRYSSVWPFCRPKPLASVTVSDELPEGPTELKFNFIKTKQFGGTGELYVNGKKADTVDMPKMHISTYSLAETFDIGRDTGTQVTKIYKDPFPFEGGLEKVVITLTD